MPKHAPPTDPAQDPPPQARDRSLVLVIDDEPSICWAFDRLLREEGHEVVTASSAEEGLLLAAERQPDMVLLDVRLPKLDGISALPRLLQVTGNAPVVVMTAFGDLETAVSAVRSGASDYLIKPFRLEDAIRTCRNVLQTSRQRTRLRSVEHTRSASQDALVGSSAAMQQAFRQIALVSDSDLSVLITGETGTGKELVAAALHRNSRRSSGPYVAVAPVALNPDLIESELFGHVQGAFTGAIADRAGLFEQAENGTLLLDEIGDLPLGTQVKLLRVLEHGQYSRVGEIHPRSSNVRVLAATNCDLHDAVQKGTFREDLFYRLTGVHIHLPPLRQRAEDIAPLCQYFLEKLNYPLGAEAIDDELLGQLAARPWYGNVRELKNAVAHAAVVARGRQLTTADFPPPRLGRSPTSEPLARSIERAVAEWARATLEAMSSEDTDLHERFLRASEPTLLQVVLQHTGGNRARAAELLGIHRATLRDRLRTYHLEERDEKPSS